MKKPLLTAKEYEQLSEFSNTTNNILGLVPKLINFEHIKVTQVIKPSVAVTSTDSLTARLVDRKVLNKDPSRPVYYYTFAVQGDNTDFKYEPGDSFGFTPELSEETVQWLAGRLQLHLDQIVSVSGGSSESEETVGDILKRLDVMSFPKKAVLRTFAEFCQDEGDAQVLLFLSSRPGSDAYNRLRSEMLSIQMLLAALDSLRPSLESLIALAGPLQPRYYSCCRAQTEKKEFQIVFNVSGVCSTWLESLTLSMNRLLPIQKRSISHFRLSEDHDRPIIMIAAGTGVAPFIGFLELLRERTVNVDDPLVLFNWLIFGFRNRKEDFIFEDELLEHSENGTLSKLSLAISRDPLEPKSHVQDMIVGKEKDLFSQLIHEKNATVYICGDELTMIKGVNDAIVQIIMERTSDLTQKEAETILMNWTRERKIIRDIWV